MAHRFLRGDPRARGGTAFAGFGPREFETEFFGMQRRLDDATVMTLWAIFERFLIEHVLAKWPEDIERPEPFATRLREKAGRAIERWRFDDILDLYKGWVDSNVLGHAKQVKGYRDWIAHRNPRKPPSAAIAPDHAYRTLASIVRSVEGDEPGSLHPTP